MDASEASVSRRLEQTKPRFGCAAAHPRGLAQLSLVEHALCPLDGSASLGVPRVFHTEYSYTDVNRHRRKADVRVTCPEGLSATDEFYLWGLLSLTFSQPKPTLDFHATPYYCLKQLGCIDGREKRGGKNYRLFRTALQRLAAVTYRNGAFYDPIRGEHRDVAFGFLSYSLPIDPSSSRAWRFAWDPIFFEFCSAARGALIFDLATYRTLDPASRRLYLLLRKVFWRNDHSPAFELRDLAVHALGFSDQHEPWRLKQKLLGCIHALLDCGVICLPEDTDDPKGLFAKQAAGHYTIRFQRGPHFEKTGRIVRVGDGVDSPLLDPLSSIGLDDATIRWVLRRFDPRLTAEIADMTLAARERFGDSFFTASPQAYFMDNLKHQAAGKRTPPDWWRDLRKRERQHAATPSADPGSPDPSAQAFEEYLETEAREAFERVMQSIFQDLRTAGQSEPDAKDHAEHLARVHFRNRFRSKRPGTRGSDLLGS